MRLQLRQGGGSAQGHKTTPAEKVTGHRDASGCIEAHAGCLLHEGAWWRIDDELDLRFFFSDAPSAAGLRSNLGPQLEALAAGLRRRGVVQVAVSDDAMVDRLDSAFRAARVGRLLRTIPPEHAAVLRAAYELDEALSPEMRARHGDELAGVVRVLAGDEQLGSHDRARHALSIAQAAYAAARHIAARRVRAP